MSFGSALPVLAAHTVSFPTCHLNRFTMTPESKVAACDFSNKHAYSPPLTRTSRASVQKTNKHHCCHTPTVRRHGRLVRIRLQLFIQWSWHCPHGFVHPGRFPHRHAYRSAPVSLFSIATSAVAKLRRTPTLRPYFCILFGTHRIRWMGARKVSWLSRVVIPSTRKAS